MEEKEIDKIEKEREREIRESMRIRVKNWSPFFTFSLY